MSGPHKDAFCYLDPVQPQPPFSGPSLWEAPPRLEYIIAYCSLPSAPVNFDPPTQPFLSFDPTKLNLKNRLGRMSCDPYRYCRSGAACWLFFSCQDVVRINDLFGVGEEGRCLVAAVVVTA